jgi:CRISPR-associated protein Csb2
MRRLIISIRFHDGRYHGSGEWPPSAARLFQALVAGVARGENLSAREAEALQWLEGLNAPVIAAPSAYAGQGFKNFVPNNDLDAVGGDPSRINEIRVGKIIRPRTFDVAVRLVYAWTFAPSADAERHAHAICEIAGNLYQLGRGIDMAWAQGAILEESNSDTWLREQGGIQWRPNGGGDGALLSCPHPGSLASLTKRFKKTRERFRTIGMGRKARQLFSQAPKPDFRQVRYNSPSTFLLFDLKKAYAFTPQPLERVVAITEKVRDQAAARLKKGLPDRAALIERIFIGHDAIEADKAQRIRITPLPSIGHAQTERSIRRVVVEVPPNCPTATSDIEWAFSGVAFDFDSETGEVPHDGAELVPADDRTMLTHYGFEHAAPTRLWRTVTPAALPERAARRRIDPRRLRDRKEQKGAAERVEEETRAVAAVVHALRHTGIAAPVETIRVQREPFAGNGARAEAFALGTRFTKERLWHVEIAFAEALRGPLIIGDGRYLGLGLLAPQRDISHDAIVFALPAEVRIAAVEGPGLVHAARRALMALARDTLGKVPRLFSGHEDDGGRAASGRHEHIFLAADDRDGDRYIDRLVVIAPWACDRSRTPDRAERQMFDAVVRKLQVLRAGRLGVINLDKPMPLADADPLTGPARVWESRTPYLATHHGARGKGIAGALICDLRAECNRRGFPVPTSVELVEFTGLPNGGGVRARARLCFGVAIHGPVLLGRDSHLGGGVFSACA